MLADIHDGQERCSTKGRIHVCKTNFAISKPLATHGRSIHQGQEVKFVH